MSPDWKFFLGNDFMVSDGATGRSRARLLAGCPTREWLDGREFKWVIACVRGPHASPGAMHRPERGRCQRQQPALSLRE